MSSVHRRLCPLPTDLILAPSELKVAQLFTKEHGNTIIWNARKQQFLLFHEHRFVLDADQAVKRELIFYIRELQQRALLVEDAHQRARLVRFLIGLEQRAKVDNVLGLVKVLKPIADAGENFDTGPLLGAQNCVVELKNGEARPGEPSDRITRATSVPFDPTAECNRWRQFLSEIFAGDQELVRWIQIAVGYTMTTSVVEQVLFILYGLGANGKSTFLNVLTWVLGDYSYAMPFATVELNQRAGIPNDVAALDGPRMVVASENDGNRLNEARIKALTGGDPITARYLHSEFFTFKPIAKIWLAVNHKPTVRDDSHGFWRRVRFIPFTQTFPLNRSLLGELEAEGPGILAWAVRGCVEWQRSGLGVPLAVAGSTSEYQADSDALQGFVDESCELRPDAEVAAHDAYAAYRAWADRQGLNERERLSATAFGRRMSERFTKVRMRSGVVYVGIECRRDVSGALFRDRTPSALSPPGSAAV